MIIKPFLVGHMSVFCYVLSCDDTNEAVIIDPGGNTEEILHYISAKSLHIRYIVNTHNHPDHTVGNREMRGATGAKIVMHELDVHLLDDPERLKLFARINFPVSDTPPPDLQVRHGAVIPFGKEKITIIHTPGHSPGGICLHCGNNLFTGDSLFVGAAGRLDLPEADFNVLLSSLEKNIAPLPPETVIRPGHDYGDTPTSTLEREKKENPFIGGQW
jgi:glyoxylase-like metal-dependent hydrolase (beta-lactamase superfamily II)